jgi:hypothetical protein
LPVEELLIVGSDGRVENRLMMTSGPTPTHVTPKDALQRCADQRAPRAVAGDQLTFTERRLRSDRHGLDRLFCGCWP